MTLTPYDSPEDASRVMNMPIRETFRKAHMERVREAKRFFEGYDFVDGQYVRASASPVAKPRNLRRALRKINSVMADLVMQ